MIPGINPRQLKQIMKQMGMSQEDIESTQVLIKTNDKVYIFDNPNVQKVTMQGQVTFQITGDFQEEEINSKVEISQDDIAMVAKQANVSDDVAKDALEKSNGDIAQAIINLTED